MNIDTDTMLLAAAALAVSIVVALIVSVWQGVKARRALARTRKALHASQAELAAAQLNVHGLAVELDQVRAQMGDRQNDIGELRENLAQLQGQLQSALRSNAELETSQRERAGQHHEQLKLLNDARDNLKKEFENLANRIFEDKGRHFTHTSRASMEDMLKPFREQIAGFQQRINEVHTESVKGNSALEAELRKVLEVGLEMNAQATNLTLALKGDKKTTGNWGEAQLQRTLELAGLQAGEHYETQAAYRDEQGKRRVPDFVIKLPDGKNLVVDSKV